MNNNPEMSIEEALEKAIELQFIEQEPEPEPEPIIVKIQSEVPKLVTHIFVAFGIRLELDEDQEIKKLLDQLNINEEKAIHDPFSALRILKNNVKYGYIDVPTAESIQDYLNKKAPGGAWCDRRFLDEIGFSYAIPERLPIICMPEDQEIYITKCKNCLKSPLATARWIQLFQNSTLIQDSASLYRMEFKLGVRFQTPQHTYVGQVPAYPYRLLNMMVQSSEFIYRPEFNRGNVFNDVYSALTSNEKWPIILMAAYNYSLEDLLITAQMPVNDLSTKVLHDKIKTTLQNWNKYKTFRTLYVEKISVYRRIREQIWRRMPPLQYEEAVWDHMRDYYPNEILNKVRNHLKQTTSQRFLTDQLQYYEQYLLGKPLEDLNIGQLLANIVNRSSVRYVYELQQLSPDFLSDKNNELLAEALDNWGLDLKKHNYKRILATLVEQFYCRQQADLFYHCLDYKMLNKLFRLGYRNGQQLVEDYENNRLKTKDKLILELAQYLQKGLLPIYVVRLS